MTDPKIPPGFVDREVIVLTRDGVWLSGAEEITHEGTLEIFTRSLRKDPDGYRLYIGHDTKLIQVEDTAYFVTRIEAEAERAPTLWLSDGTQEKLDPTTLTYRPGRLTCRIKNGGEEAKFLRAPYNDLLRNLEEDSGHFYVDLGGKRIELATKP